MVEGCTGCGLSRRSCRTARDHRRRDQAIHDAIQAGDVPAALRLLAGRPEPVDEPLLDEVSPLRLAVGRMAKGTRPVVEWLLGRGARADLDPSLPALYWLCAGGDEHPDLVARALDVPGVAVDCRTLHDGHTPLVAARNAQPRTVGLLLARRAETTGGAASCAARGSGSGSATGGRTRRSRSSSRPARRSRHSAVRQPSCTMRTKWFARFWHARRVGLHPTKDSSETVSDWPRATIVIWRTP